MKLKYILPAFIAAAAFLTTACDEDNDPTYLSEVQVSSSTVALDAAGGSQKITLNATADWAFDAIPEWLTIEPAAGSAGQHEVTFTAGEATASHDDMLKLVVGSKAQLIRVMQVAGKVELPLSSCADVINGPDGNYRVKGTCTRIANTSYGNWYLDDGTGELYIYGTLDKKGSAGANNSIAAWGIEVGDIITVEGPKTVYGTTIELVNVTVIEIEKSLIKVDSLSATELPLEGGDLKVYLTSKGNGLSIDIPEAAKSWLSVTGIETAGNNAVVTLHAAENAGGDRSATLTFRTASGGKEYTSEATVAQKGAIVDVTVAGFLAADEDATQYRVTGIITSVANPTYGNVYIRDFSGEVYVYGIGAKGDFEAAGLKAGDIVTLVGKRASYGGSPQMSGAVLESSISVVNVNVAEFLAAEAGQGIYYCVTGKVDEIVAANYGNLYLTDGTNRVYSYGCYPGWGATGNDRQGCVEKEGIEVGDELSIIGTKTIYNGVEQINGGIFFSLVKAAK